MLVATLFVVREPQPVLAQACPNDCYTVEEQCVLGGGSYYIESCWPYELCANTVCYGSCYNPQGGGSFYCRYYDWG